MADFRNAECPVCHNRFAKDDDIVVCPVCGTPHHRSCYFELGHCANHDRHDAGYQWAPQAGEQTGYPEEARNAEQEEKVCPRCGWSNPHGSVACQKCGCDLQHPFAATPFPGTEASKSPFPPLNNPAGFVPPLSDFSDINLNEEFEDGVLVGDIAAYLGNGAYYYLPRFLDIKKTGKKIKWNFAGFFLSFLYPVWLAFRRMYLVAAITLLVTSAISIAINFPVLQQLFASLPQGLSYQAYAELYNSLMEYQSYHMTAGMYILAYLGQYGPMVIFGLFGNYFYMRHVVKKVKKLKSRAESLDEFMYLSLKKGGASVTGILGFLAVYALVCVLLALVAVLFTL